MKYDVVRLVERLNLQFKCKLKAKVCGFPEHEIFFISTNPNDAWHDMVTRGLSRIITQRRHTTKNRVYSNAIMRLGVARYGYKNIKGRSVFSKTGSHEDKINSYIYYRERGCGTKMNEQFIHMLGVTVREASELVEVPGAVRMSFYSTAKKIYASAEMTAVTNAAPTNIQLSVKDILGLPSLRQYTYLFKNFYA